MSGANRYAMLEDNTFEKSYISAAWQNCVRRTYDEDALEETSVLSERQCYIDVDFRAE